MDTVELGLVAPSGSDEVEGIGYLAGAELAGRALATRLHIEEPRQDAGDVDHAGGVVVNDETGSAKPAAHGLHGLIAERGIELVGGEDRVRDSGEHRPDEPARKGPAARVEHVSQWGAQLDFDHAGPCDVANDSAHDGAGGLGGANGPEPFGASGEDVGEVGQGLDVIDESRVGPLPAVVAGFGIVGLPAQFGSGGKQTMQVGGASNGGAGRCPQ